LTDSAGGGGISISPLEWEMGDSPEGGMRAIMQLVEKPAPHPGRNALRLTAGTPCPQAGRRGLWHGLGSIRLLAVYGEKVPAGG
jgi:hypothetical protein